MIKNYEFNDKGKVRFTRLLEFKSSSILYEGSGLGHNKFNTIIKWFHIPSSPDRAIEIIDLALEKYDEIGSPDYNWPEDMEEFSLEHILNELVFSVFANYSKHIEMVTTNSYPAFKKIHETYLGNLARRDAVRICLALQEFKLSNGRWPRTLDSIKPLLPAEVLIDPTNGLGYVYYRNDDGFVLCSKGINGIDDNGESRTSYDGSTKTEYDDYQFWPPKTRLKEEQEKIEMQEIMLPMPDYIKDLPMPGMHGIQGKESGK